MKLKHLFENVVPLRPTSGYVVVVVDEADSIVPQDQFEGHPVNMHRSVQQAEEYIKAYHSAYYPNTQIYEVPKEHYPGGDGSVFDVDIPQPVNNKVYGLYDPHEKRGDPDKFGFWLPDAYLWIVASDNIPEFD